MHQMIRSKRRILSVVLVLCLGTALFPRPVSAAAGGPPLPDLPTFVSSVVNGDAGALRGVYADDLFALQVVQQPESYPAYVSRIQNSVTQFRLAARLGNVGVLAHNFLSGRYFFDLHPAQTVELVYGGGRIEVYRVTRVYRYRAVNPRSTNSDFIDMDSSERLSADQLFEKVYEGPRHVTFQTCITRDGNSSWGRLFVLAEPDEARASSLGGP